jgi:hypothetical protein
MTTGWNFERRRDTATRFLMGVAQLTKDTKDKGTNLEAVRNRMRLSPEEALFSARKLAEDHLITFEEGGAVRSNAAGLDRARTLVEGIRAKAQRFDELARTLRDLGPPVAVLAAVIRADGGTLACGSPSSEPDVAHRLALDGDAVILEREGPDGIFVAVPSASSFPER